MNEKESAISNLLNSILDLIESGLQKVARLVRETYTKLTGSELVRKSPMGPLGMRSEKSNSGEYAENMPPRVCRIPDGECVYAIGDIHGRFDLLQKLMSDIFEDVKTLPEGTKVTLIFLGDYIDRGLQSKQVIDYFLSDALSDFELVFLMGNHEQALLQFENDATFGSNWAAYGGSETLFSYGFAPPPATLQSSQSGTGEYASWATVWNNFRVHMPKDHITFFRELLPYYVIGDYVFVHAGMRPEVSLENQSTDDLFWIRDEFLKDHRPFEKMVVHGHTPEEDVYADYRRVGLDTGAYITGRLSAGRFFGTNIAFLST